VQGAGGFFGVEKRFLQGIVYFSFQDSLFQGRPKRFLTTKGTKKHELFRVGWCVDRNIQKFYRQFPSFFSA
jgi:hypothetical protein